MFQGVLIFVLFDLKRKVYFVAFEKVVGRPHPKFHRTRPIKNYANPTSISSEATRAPTPRPSFAEDEIVEEDYGDDDDDLQEVKNDVQESRKMTPRVVRRTKCNIEPQTELPNVKNKRQKTVSQSWTSTFSYERTSSESDIDRYSCEDDSPNEVRPKNLGLVRNVPANRDSSRAKSVKTFEHEDEEEQEEEEVRALSFNPETEAEIRLRATSLRCLRKKLRDGSIDVSNFDSYQQLKIFQDILRQEEDKKSQQKVIRNEHLERVKESRKPKFHTPPPPIGPPPVHQPRKSRQLGREVGQKSKEFFEIGADFRDSSLQVASLSAMPSLMTLHCDDFKLRKMSKMTNSMFSSNASFRPMPSASHTKLGYIHQDDGVTASLQSVSKRRESRVVVAVPDQVILITLIRPFFLNKENGANINIFV